MLESHFPRITIDPDIMGGAPCIRGLRIPASTIVKMIEIDGMSIEEVLEAYPDLELEDIKEALIYDSITMQLKLDSITMQLKLLRIITKKKEEIETLKSTLNAFVAGAANFGIKIDEEADTNLDYVRIPPPKNPAQVYSIKIPVDVLEALRRKAAYDDLTPEEYIQRLVVSHLKWNPE